MHVALIIDNKLVQYLFSNKFIDTRKKASLAMRILFKVKTTLIRKFGNSISHLFTRNFLIICGLTYPSYLKKLAVLQNKAVLQVGSGDRLQTVTLFFVSMN